MTLPLESSRLNRRHQQESYDPSSVTDEELPWPQQALNGPYQLNCKIVKTCELNLSFNKQHILTN